MSYNCDSARNTYRDFKEADIWTDAPLSNAKYPLTPQKPSSAYNTQPPRTSSPIPDILINDNQTSPEVRDAYTAWKDHLHETPTKMKVRGALFTNNEFISGHLVMKEHEKREYNKENHYIMPTLNKCFVNLLINGPAPLVCRVHGGGSSSGNTGHRNYLSKCSCLPSCTCERDLVHGTHLPIGYRHNEHGLVVPVGTVVGNDVYYRDPMCIYTN